MVNQSTSSTLVAEPSQTYMYMYMTPCWKLVTKQLKCMRHSPCTSNQFCINYYIQLIHVFCLVHLYTCTCTCTCTCSYNKQCPYRIAFTHVSLMLSCLGTATITLYYVHVHVVPACMPCCLFGLACFFLPSFSSLIKTCVCTHAYIHVVYCPFHFFPSHHILTTET